ncbi:MAG: HD-GYP domain-containing protein [Proteobacteria bacterium]|nr:HD domain-containing protein [Desulfobulbaceae bacterium]MBU4153363.1 HD-GYP domain-containing protein [Pseudomonadota bacterium]MDP2105656.1 HD-GYP domain-containing protein [Desulfobulbaceae bacterium]
MGIPGLALHHLIIAIGLVFLLASIYQSRKIGEYIPSALRSRWSVINALIGFFVLGYMAEFFSGDRHSLGLVGYVVGLVYLGGAVFVFLVMRLSRLAMRQIRHDEHKITKMNQELWDAYESTIEGWGRALELRDRETEGHTRRVCTMTMALAERFDFTPGQLRYIKFGSLLHDIGKMAVPDVVLMNEGPLSEAEKMEMMRHPDYARQMLSGINFLLPALDIPYCHHERWDGSGYPRGLKGEEIPLAARIFAVADVWDALAHDRRYHKAWSVEDICDHIRCGGGSRFDPQVVAQFLKLDLCGVEQAGCSFDAG